MELSANELIGRLDAEAASHRDKVRALERERDRLLQAKHSGDAKAVRRSKVLRVELSDLAEALQEIAQLQARLQPRLIRERAEDMRTLRMADAMGLAALLEHGTELMKAVDAAIDALASATAAVAPVIAEAKLRGADLIVAQTSDPGAIAVNRMLAMTLYLLPSIQGAVEQRLLNLDVLPVESGWKPQVGSLLETFHTGGLALMDRVKQRLTVDHIQAEEAAVEREAELAEAEMVEEVA